MKLSDMRNLVGGMLMVLVLPAQSGELNDTGQSSCYDGTWLVACSSANSGDAAPHPRQDGRFGRDAQAAAGTLAKTGGGAEGFDFTRVCMSGEVAGQGSCPANPVQGTGPNEWACTRDNVTNLVWSLESGLGDWAYATTTYPAAMNVSGRCGFTTGWRVPSRRELMSIIHFGIVGDANYHNSLSDIAYFPENLRGEYWTADNYALDPADAWQVNHFGSVAVTKIVKVDVLLVRSRQ